jgi:acylpyruvate hydrolase
MKFATFSKQGTFGIGIVDGDSVVGLFENQPSYPGSIETLIATGEDALMIAGRKLAQEGSKLSFDDIRLEPPLRRAPKIICVGLNYIDHTSETGFEQPEYPTLFGRFPSSLTGPYDRLPLSPLSEEFDFEGELAVVIGTGGYKISKEDALDHVIGYSVFNDASYRDYQFKSPQWTAGKNFDETGVFGPYLVTADALPAGCKGLVLETRLNGKTVQRASIDDMVFDVATLIHILSDFMTLEPNDIIVSGTPSGVGMARDPKLWMKDGDVVEVEIDRVGLIRNTVVAV